MRRALAGAVSLAVAAAAAAGDSFRVPKEQVVARVHVVALAPLRDYTQDGVPAATQARWEAVLTQELRAAGLEVVPSTEFDRIWRTLAGELGGVWDPVSGRADDAKRAAVRKHTFGELQRLHTIDAVVDWALGEASTNDPHGERTGWIQEAWSVGGEALTIGGEPLVTRAVTEHPSRAIVAAAWLFLSDRNDVTLYQRGVDVAWTEVRNGDRHERRSPDVAFAPARDDRLRELVKPLRDAYAAARSPAGAGAPPIPQPAGATPEASPPKP